MERSQYTKWKLPEKSSVRVSVMRTSPLGLTVASTVTLVMEKSLAAAGPAVRPAAPAATSSSTPSASRTRRTRAASRERFPLPRPPSMTATLPSAVAGDAGPVAPAATWRRRR